jgi:hypothetical protein
MRMIPGLDCFVVAVDLCQHAVQILFLTFSS